MLTFKSLYKKSSDNLQPEGSSVIVESSIFLTVHMCLQMAFQRKYQELGERNGRGKITIKTNSVTCSI